ncbi:MAG: DUF177 domain-containing protein [Bacteroidales bacterium]|jgi:uncharacterized metal-binding protein YceD (DUF177 family)|nr:DUF177 domain-containing protein [Bacteroidales bacterium]
MDYIINFASLALGEYRYEFKVDKTLFLEFKVEEEDILDADIVFNVLMDKKEDILTFNFDFNGQIKVLCDRCLEELPLKIKGKDTLYVQFSDKDESYEDDILFLPFDEREIDLKQYIYECIYLHIPLRRVHKEGECNENMLRLIQEKDDVLEQEVDVRWEKLKEIKVN